MAMVKIDKQGRVTIPSPLRDRLGLSPQSALLVEEVAEGILVRPAVERLALEEGKPFLPEEHTPYLVEEFAPGGGEVVVREDALRPIERAAIFKRLAS